MQGIGYTVHTHTHVHIRTPKILLSNRNVMPKFRQWSIAKASQLFASLSKNLNKNMINRLFHFEIHKFYSKFFSSLFLFFVLSLSLSVSLFLPFFLFFQQELMQEATQKNRNQNSDIWLMRELCKSNVNRISTFRFNAPRIRMSVWLNKDV